MSCKLLVKTYVGSPGTARISVTNPRSSWATMVKMNGLIRNIQFFIVLSLIIRPRSHGTGSVWPPYQFEKSQDEHDS